MAARAEPHVIQTLFTKLNIPAGQWFPGSCFWSVMVTLTWCHPASGHGQHMPPQPAAVPAAPAADPPWDLALKQSMHIKIYSNTFNTKLCDTNVWHLSPWYLLHPFLLGFLLNLSPLLPAPLQGLACPCVVLKLCHVSNGSNQTSTCRERGSGCII